MKKLSFLASRQFLALVALIVVALVIWFVGPLISFGSLKPFEGAGMRVLVIVLLLAGLLLWLAEKSTLVVIVALLCLLIWNASPLLAFGNAQPFASESARLTAIAVVLTAFTLYCVFRLWQKMRSDEKFLKSLIEFGGKKEPSPAASQLHKLTDSIALALSRLKVMRTGASGLGKLFQGKRYLYELPWYITLGSQSSGKTSALLNAGLKFPIAEQMQRATVAKTGDSASVDWWLTNDAVLIDTSGHYTHHGTSHHELSAPAAAPAKKSSTDDSAGKARRDELRKEPGEQDSQSAVDEAKATTATSAGTATVTALGADTADLRRRIDEAEWLGFLELLRNHRPRAPINGALLTVDLGKLTGIDANERIAEAAYLRARLAELRARLGIRFPVYLLITKIDQLTGFAEYFGSLTAEGRAQVWGFSLPNGKETIASEDVRVRCNDELKQLAARLADGIDTRLKDEHDTGTRRALTALSDEFSSITGPLAELIERVFLDSRYDDTLFHPTLRGVYFTSATQAGGTISAKRSAVAQRLAATNGENPSIALTPQPGGNQSFFLSDLLTKVVFAEAHLVRPNLRWEFRFKLLRLTGHALAVLLFVWLAISWRISFGNNSGYLDAIAHKAEALATRVAQLYGALKPQAVPETLNEAHQLPAYPGLDLTVPGLTWRFGLYAAPEVVTESRRTYDALEDNLLLPQIVHRMEGAIAQAISNDDPKTAYDTLRVYLMLYDKAKFNADDVKAWVLNDWVKTDSASVFGGRASMIDHVQELFSGARIVQSPLIRNDALIQRARSFLDASNATERLYERAKAAMHNDAPDEFTLIRAVGPQAGTVFTRASGAPLSRGVPGLFTFNGYRNLFDKRLPEFVRAARDDDAWVMGRVYLGSPQNEAQKKTAELTRAATGADDPITEAIRRQYLTEYARQWGAFLGDIRTVTGTSLPFNLQVLRSFAAPDSPLVRLARATVHETTLTQPIAASDTSFLQKATGQLGQKADKALGIRASERVERELVDSRFAALREVVTGNAEALSGAQDALGQAGKTGLDGVTNLLNDYYTALTVAENALSNNSMPPASDTAAKLKMTADTMPAPFHAVLSALGAEGSREVNRGIGQLLSRQMESVLGDTCRLAIEGNYPFAPDSKRDVGIDDFTRVFAQGGVIDDFFTKTLAPFVDTSARPWRYRTLPGATEPVQGPDLEPFQHATAIRDMFFADPGQKQLTWKADIRIPELDPAITALVIDIDGQTMLYQHGPVAPSAVNWPGPRGGVHAQITATPRIRADTSMIGTDGPWALMRLMQKGHVVETAIPGRTRVEFDFDGRKSVLDIASPGTVANPLTSDVLRTFKCPSSMPIFSPVDTGPPPGLPPAPPFAPHSAHAAFSGGSSKGTAV
ncbi:MAG: type secretion system protein ImpL [Paraburkholderia sp.]|jgi:type VI secretion system protein ImpL|nr:type secretion system protein ImpL [Paraburkholderia sp.]